MILLGRKGKAEELFELLFPFIYIGDIIPTIKAESDEDDYTYNKHITQVIFFFLFIFLFLILFLKLIILF